MTDEPREEQPKEVEMGIRVDTEPPAEGIAPTRLPVVSPIVETLDTWPVAGQYTMRWGRDGEGRMWVAVEDEQGTCEGFQPYDEYLEREKQRPRDMNG